jgi:hypothetical protein
VVQSDGGLLVLVGALGAVLAIALYRFQVRSSDGEAQEIAAFIGFVGLARLLPEIGSWLPSFPGWCGRDYHESPSHAGFVQDGRPSLRRLPVRMEGRDGG